MTVLVSICGGIIPMLIYPLFFYWMDRYEKEPIILLAVVFAWGFIPAAILSIISQVILNTPVMLLDESGIASEVIGSIFWAPITEEIFKGLAVAFVFFILRGEFDGVFDGIIYGAMVGFGFAAIENILYFLSAQGDPLLIFFRAFVFGLNHALYTSMIGIGFGLARHRRSPFLRLAAPLVGLLVAIALHMAHNIVATLVIFASGAFLLAGILLNWLLVTVVFVTMLLSIRQERKWVTKQLLSEVELGTLTQKQYESVTSPAGRFWFRVQAFQNGGVRNWWRAGKYLQVLTKLAYRKQSNMQAGEILGANEGDIAAFRERAISIRDQLS